MAWPTLVGTARIGTSIGSNQNMDGTTFGERIRDLRLNRNLSLRRLARRIGISAPFLSDIELGRRFPSEVVLRALAKELGVKPAHLKEYDHRESITTLRRLSMEDPEWRLALRTATNQIKKGLTPEQLIRRLTESKRESNG